MWLSFHHKTTQTLNPCLSYHALILTIPLRKTYCITLPPKIQLQHQAQLLPSNLDNTTWERNAIHCLNWSPRYIIAIRIINFTLKFIITLIEQSKIDPSYFPECANERNANTKFACSRVFTLIKRVFISRHLCAIPDIKMTTA